MIASPATAVEALRETSALLYRHGWAFGTSGNYSLVLSRQPLRLLITASGRDKSHLEGDDFVVVDEEGMPTVQSAAKPSAETLLHCRIARDTTVGAVLHTHSVWNTLLSDACFSQGHVRIAGLEMLKGLRDIGTHETEVRIPIFDNTQDIPALARRVTDWLDSRGEDLRHAFLIRGHGLYTWGRDLAEARRHVEILEFLFEVVGRRMQFDAAPHHSPV